MMTDRERLVQALYDVLDQDEHATPRVISENYDLAGLLANAVDQVLAPGRQQDAREMHDLRQDRGAWGHGFRAGALAERAAVLAFLIDLRDGADAHRLQSPLADALGAMLAGAIDAIHARAVPVQ